jgi:hypothetical protein
LSENYDSDIFRPRKWLKVADFSGKICRKSIFSPLMGIMVGSVFGELWKGKEFWILCQLDY